MVNSLGYNPALTTSRERANRNRRFCVHRDAQCLRVRIRLGLQDGEPFEDGVCLGELFLGLALATLVGW